MIRADSPPGAGWGGTGRGKFPVAVAALLVLLAGCSILMIRLPLSDLLPYWFWRPIHTPLPWVALFVPALALALGGMMLIRRGRQRAWLNLIMLVLVGGAMQHAYALMEGRGINGMRDRMLHTGHSIFAWEATRQPDMLAVARGYQKLIEKGVLESYPTGTKPPGQLLFYMLTERASRFLAGGERNPLVRMATFAAYLWPFLSYLCLIPLYYLARFCLDERRAYIPCLLYLTLPAPTLITLHLDQCLYPLLFMSALVLLAYGAGSRGRWFIFLAGVVTGLSVFISFSLVVLLPFLLMILFLGALPLRSGKREGWRRISLQAAWCLSGFLLTQIVIHFLFDYNVLANYKFAMSLHQAFKVKQWGLTTVLYVGLLDLGEFVLWTGAAVSVLGLFQLIHLLRRRTAWEDPCAILGVAFIPVLMGMAFLGKTVAETARLWLFLEPLVALFAGLAVLRIFRERPWGSVAAVMTLQSLAVLAIKAWQDFH